MVKPRHAEELFKELGLEDETTKTHEGNPQAQQPESTYSGGQGSSAPITQSEQRVKIPRPAKPVASTTPEIPTKENIDKGIGALDDVINTEKECNEKFDNIIRIVNEYKSKNINEVTDMLVKYFSSIVEGVKEGSDIYYRNVNTSDDIKNKYTTILKQVKDVLNEMKEPIYKLVNITGDLFKALAKNETK